MKKSKKQINQLKIITLLKADIRIELILHPKMMIKIEAADDWDLWSVPEICQRSPAIAIAHVCKFFWQDRPFSQHPDIAELKELAQIMSKYSAGLPIIQLIGEGWHLPLPDRKAAA
jgi:hypothetical protein